MYLIDEIWDDEWMENRLMKIKPTHWMELPQPPIIKL
jgi:hypothetical protein